jgi:hypothetical protein
VVIVPKEDIARRSDQPALRTGKPFCSANDRNCFSANRRPRPAAGIKTPAHTPSAPGVSQASRAQSHRRGHSRQSALAPSSASVVHRSGSRAHRISGTPDSCTQSALSIASDNMAVLYLRYSHTVDRVEYAGISHRCMNDVRAAGDCPSHCR